MAVAQPVAYQTEKIRAALGVIAGAVRAAGIPFEPGDRDRLGEHGLPERGTASVAVSKHEKG